MTCPELSTDGQRCTRPADHPSNCFYSGHGAVVVWNLNRKAPK